MGKATLTKLAASPVQTPAVPEQPNAIIDALLGLFIMRNATTGIEEDGVSDLGEPGNGRPRDINFTRNLVQNGQVLDTSKLSLLANGIISGEAKTSGFPAFMAAGGGSVRKFSLLGLTTNLYVSIQGVLSIITNDILSGTLPVAPSTGNTCVINDTNFASQFWTKLFGEYGGRASDGLEHGELTIGTVGSGITALVNTIQAFEVGSEVFLALIKSTTSLLIIRRGMCGTSRSALANGETITLLQANWAFMRNDLLTITTTTTIPAYGPTAPTSPNAGDYWYDTINKWWVTYVGGTWSVLYDVFIGMAVTDAAGCQWVECDDFNLGYSSDIEGKICVFWRILPYPVEGL